MFNEKSVKLPRSATFLKQLADGSNPKAQEKPDVFDDVTPLDVNLFPDISDKPKQNVPPASMGNHESVSMGDLVSPSMGTDLSNKAAATKHYHASSATKQPIFAKLHSAKSMSPTQQLPVKGVSVTLNQPEGRVTCQLQVEHGLPLKKLVHFYTSAKCILSNQQIYPCYSLG